MLQFVAVCEHSFESEAAVLEMLPLLQLYQLPAA